MKKLHVLFVIVSLPFLLISTNIHAATLVVDASGELFQAKDVSVDGKLYNVSFVDGSCVSLFNGCDETSDFAFNSDTLAFEAAGTLLSQVLNNGILGLFDSKPDLTAGCSDPKQCITSIPYGFYSDTDLVRVKSSANSTCAASDRICSSVDAYGDSFGEEKLLDFTTLSNRNWAIFTPVPIPPAAILFISATGLLCISYRHRKTI